MNVAIVTGANSKFWPLMADLINSIRTKPEGREVPICVMDLGLDPDQLNQLRRHVTSIVRPGWDIDFPDQAKQPIWFQGFVARPFLRSHFPGYDVYFYVDADAWIQDWRAVKAYVSAAAEGKLAITAELDRCMIPRWIEEMKRIGGMAREMYRLGWDDTTSRKLAPMPMLNSGVFALHSEAPHWDAWRDSLTEALAKTSNFMVELSAINHAVYLHGLPVTYLPLYCNWLCHLAMPKYNRKTGYLVEPEAPYAPLGVLHLAKRTKFDEFDLDVIGGGSIRTSLRFGKLGKG